MRARRRGGQRAARPRSGRVAAAERGGAERTRRRRSGPGEAAGDMQRGPRARAALAARAPARAEATRDAEAGGGAGGGTGGGARGGAAEALAEARAERSSLAAALADADAELHGDGHAAAAVEGARQRLVFEQLHATNVSLAEQLAIKSAELEQAREKLRALSPGGRCGCRRWCGLFGPATPLGSPGAGSPGKRKPVARWPTTPG